MTTITVPNNYGYTIISVVGYSLFLVPTLMSGEVMKARKQYNVQYPNLYAVPGYHKDADAFNRVQRGHQALFEQLTTFTVSALIGGLKYPLANAAFAVIYSTGAYLYMMGYKDTSKDVQVARHLKGGPIKYIGYLGSIFSALALGADLCGLKFF